MKINKYIDSITVHELLEKVISDNSIPLNKRVELYRFVDKLSDSAEYEFRVNKDFSAYKLTHNKDHYVECINNRETIQLPCEFELRPTRITNWELYHCDKVFLPTIDRKTALKIALDINIAFSLKHAQISRIHEENKESVHEVRN